jgi:hypothetical protein
MKSLFLLLLLGLSVLRLQASVLVLPNQPPAGTWTPNIAGGVGVVGGIPARTGTIIDLTTLGYSIDPTGVLDSAPGINQAIVDYNGAGQTLYLPAGTYKVSYTIDGQRDNYTIRGAGTALTKINWTGTTGSLIKMGKQASGGSSTSITSGLTAGTTALTVGSTANFVVGGLAIIAEQDDITVPVVYLTDGQAVKIAGNRSRTQTVTVTSITDGTHLVISHKLLWTLSSGRAPLLIPYLSNLRQTGVGLENLEIDCTNTTSGVTSAAVHFGGCVGSWMKNVKISYSKSYPVLLQDCVNCEIRDSFINVQDHVGSNGSGICLQANVGGCLIENNIIYKSFPNIEVNFGASGCVFGYNYCLDSTIITTVGCSIDSNHGPHNHFNLYEGNRAGLFQCDGYFGSTSQDTVYRNWFTSTSPGATPRYPVILNRFTRQYQLAGNMLGTPGQTTTGTYLLGTPAIGNDGSGVGTASLIGGTPWADWAAYTAGTLNVFPLSNVTTTFQEIDLDVAGTLTKKANYNTLNAAIPAGESISPDTLADSLYLSAKPSWWGAGTFPAYDPFAPVFSETTLPAGARYAAQVGVISATPRFPFSPRQPRGYIIR